MKIVLYTLMFLCVTLIGVNLYTINYQSFFDKQNTISFIGIIAPIATLLLLIIFKKSKEIQNKLNE